MPKRVSDGVRKKEGVVSAHRLREDVIVIPRTAERPGFVITDETEKISDPIITIGEEISYHRSPRLVWWGVGTGLVFCIIGFIALTTVFARLTVTVKPRVENLTAQGVSVLLDTSVSRILVKHNVVPAQLLEFSRNLQQEFESTGRKFVEEKARGKVKIYNAFSSSPQRLLAQTRFITDRGSSIVLERKT